MQIVPLDASKVNFTQYEDIFGHITGHSVVDNKIFRLTIALLTKGEPQTYWCTFRQKNHRWSPEIISNKLTIPTTTKHEPTQPKIPPPKPTTPPTVKPTTAKPEVKPIFD